MGLLGGHSGVLVEPSWIGRSLVRCISGRVCPVPDEVAAAACVFEFILGVSLYGAGLSFYFVLEGNQRIVCPMACGRCHFGCPF